MVLLNAEDIKELGVEAGQVVDLTSHYEGQRRVARSWRQASGMPPQDP